MLVLPMPLLFDKTSRVNTVIDLEQPFTVAVDMKQQLHNVARV